MMGMTWFLSLVSAELGFHSVICPGRVSSWSKQKSFLCICVLQGGRGVSIFLIFYCCLVGLYFDGSHFILALSCLLSIVFQVIWWETLETIFIYNIRNEPINLFRRNPPSFARQLRFWLLKWGRIFLKSERQDWGGSQVQTFDLFFQTSRYEHLYEHALWSISIQSPDSVL